MMMIEGLWRNIDKMVENEIKQCSTCQLVNSGGYRPEPLKM